MELADLQIFQGGLLDPVLRLPKKPIFRLRLLLLLRLKLFRLVQISNVLDRVRKIRFLLLDNHLNDVPEILSSLIEGKEIRQLLVVLNRVVIEEIF